MNLSEDDLIQAAEEQWMVLSAISNLLVPVEQNAWHWFWLMLAETFYPSTSQEDIELVFPGTYRRI